MVCKENVVSWFGNLSSYKRIDVLCTLLNMCLPFEIRYLGTCIEDRGKRDYNDLRDTEHHANNNADLTELANLGVTDTRTRRKLVLYIALLHACNYECASVIYKSLSNLDIQEIISLIGTSHDEQLLEELLLLYTMALNHPAFNYEQKSTFGNIYLKLQEEEESRNNLKPMVNMSYKSAPGCGPCDSNERLADPVEMTANCTVPPPMHHYPGDMHLRSNSIVSGIPSNLTMPPPPPGMCLPPPDQIAMNPPNTPQYLHLGFPAINTIAPWTGQTMVIGNQMMYHTGDMITYPASPLVSRPSSPSQSRSPSRSNSPLGRRNNQVRWSLDDRSSGPLTPMTSNAVSVSNATNNQTNSTSTNVSYIIPPPLIGSNRNIPSTQQATPLPSRSTSQQPISSLTTPGSYPRHNSIDNTNAAGAQAPLPKHQPPSRLRPSLSADLLRETLVKEMPNYKGNLQNHTLEDIRRMSDDELKDIGLTPNAVTQLRNVIRSQLTVNGLNQMSIDKKVDHAGNLIHTPVSEQSDNEAVQVSELSNEASISTQKIPLIQDLHQSIHHHHHHHHHHHSHPSNISGVRRYQAIQPHVEPSQISIYHSPPAMYATQTPCYACLTVPVAGMQNRYPRCNAQHMYCVAQLQALRLDSDNNRQCSQSSSSDSTGSRSPPETPPAAPCSNSNSTTLITNDSCSISSGTTEQTSGSSVLSYSTVTVSHQNISTASQQQLNERTRSSKKHQMMRKNQAMNGGGTGNGNSSGSGNNGGTIIPPPPPPVNLSTPHCISAFPGPTNHPQMAFLPHGHFPALRPNSGIYTSGFSHSIFSRPTYQPSYQPNGEIIYPYPGQPGAAGGTPPPPPPPLPPTGTITTAVAAVGVAPSPTYLQSAPVVPHTSTVQPTKISCYNCGSNNHLAGECKDQTMEDLTKRAQYRLDYSIMKQPGECSDE